MGKTSIEWTDVSWNPVRGCSRVSRGCEHCYAERIAARFAGKGGRFEGFVQISNGHPQWTGKVQLIEAKLEEPQHWRQPRRVFVNSMSDLFYEDLHHNHRAKVAVAMQQAPWHTYQILTKRPEVMRDFAQWWCMQNTEPRLPSNWWMGVSVEDQKTADERIPVLLETPAKVRFVSYEPALGPVDVKTYLEFESCGGGHRTRNTRLNWVIIGGESGPGARPFDLEWARNTVRQCRASSVPVFVKQLGSRPTTDHRTRPEGESPFVILRDSKGGGEMSEWPEDLRVREYPR